MLNVKRNYAICRQFIIYCQIIRFILSHFTQTFVKHYSILSYVPLQNILSSMFVIVFTIPPFLKNGTKKREKLSLFS